MLKMPPLSKLPICAAIGIPSCNESQLNRQQLYSAIEKVPGAVELRLKLGQILLGPPFQQLEKAAANLLLVSRQIPNYDWAHDLFGIVIAMRDRPRIAYPSLMQALRLNPNNIRSRKRLEDIRPLLKGKTPNP